MNSIGVKRLGHGHIYGCSDDFNWRLKSFPCAISKQLCLRLLRWCVSDVSLFRDNAKFVDDFALLWIFEIDVLCDLKSILGLRVG